jgi:hydroxypyruvate reductase
VSLDRVACVDAFLLASQRCGPERLVVRGMHEVVGPLAARTTYGLALGKAALKMARGAGPVARGVVVTNADDGLGVPDGWSVIVSSHPEPDERSVFAGEAVVDLVAGCTRDDLCLALISGGASSLVELPAPGISIAELRERVAACMASGADIHAINRLRGELSRLKAGKLARMCDAPVATLAVSDVYDDDLAVIGSGPTFANRPDDRASVIAPMRSFATTIASLIPGSHFLAEPQRSDVAQVATDLVDAWDRHGGAVRITHATSGFSGTIRGERRGLRVGWGEPTVTIAEPHGEGGRAQQLALLLARKLRGDWTVNAFIAGSDGIDGPAPAHRRSPAGAFIDNKSWDRIADAGIDPEQALLHRDAGTALDAIGALVVTGPTGINHADVMVIG